MTIVYTRVSEDTWVAHFLGHRLGQVWRTLSGWRHDEDSSARFETKERAGLDLYEWIKGRVR